MLICPHFFFVLLKNTLTLAKYIFLPLLRFSLACVESHKQPAVPLCSSLSPLSRTPLACLLRLPTLTRLSLPLRLPLYQHPTLDAFWKMYHHECLRSFHSSLAPTLLDLTHVGVQFPVYEYMKGKFAGGVALGKQREDRKTSFGRILLASCLSKFCASSATYPHEVLRTRLQTQRILNDATAAVAGSDHAPLPRRKFGTRGL
jgi:hypothetical protein